MSALFNSDVIWVGCPSGKVFLWYLFYLNNKEFSDRLCPGLLPSLSENISNGGTWKFKSIAFKSKGENLLSHVPLLMFFAVDNFLYGHAKGPALC